jgi:hypothetical protein
VVVLNVAGIEEREVEAKTAAVRMAAAESFPAFT